MWKSVATAHENRSRMGHATNVESFWLAGASSATPPCHKAPQQFAPHVAFSALGDFPIVVPRAFPFSVLRVREKICMPK